MAQKRIKRTTETRSTPAPKIARTAAHPTIDLAAELDRERRAPGCVVCSSQPHILEAIAAWRDLPREQQVSVCALHRVLQRHGATFQRETLRNHLNRGH